MADKNIYSIIGDKKGDYFDSPERQVLKCLEQYLKSKGLIKSGLKNPSLINQRFKFSASPAIKQYLLIHHQEALEAVNDCWEGGGGNTVGKGEGYQIKSLG